MATVPQSVLMSVKGTAFEVPFNLEVGNTNRDSKASVL